MKSSNNSIRITTAAVAPAVANAKETESAIETGNGRVGTVGIEIAISRKRRTESTIEIKIVTESETETGSEREIAIEIGNETGIKTKIVKTAAAAVVATSVVLLKTRNPSETGQRVPEKVVEIAAKIGIAPVTRIPSHLVTRTTLPRAEATTPPAAMCWVPPRRPKDLHRAHTAAARPMC
jgi:hypothetical protein